MLYLFICDKEAHQTSTGCPTKLATPKLELVTPTLELVTPTAKCLSVWNVKTASNIRQDDLRGQ